MAPKRDGIRDRVVPADAASAAAGAKIETETPLKTKSTRKRTATVATVVSGTTAKRRKPTSSDRVNVEVVSLSGQSIAKHCVELACSVKQFIHQLIKDCGELAKDKVPHLLHTQKRFCLKMRRSSMWVSLIMQF